MTTPHVIRLRDPWDCEPIVREPSGPDTHRVVRCTRRFNAPTNLDANERVWLLCDAVAHRATFVLNDRHLGTIEGYRAQPRIDITEALRPHNLLAIEVEFPADDSHSTSGPLGLPGGIGEVRLEIARHAPDWQIESLDNR